MAAVGYNFPTIDARSTPIFQISALAQIQNGELSGEEFRRTYKVSSEELIKWELFFYLLGCDVIVIVEYCCDNRDLFPTLCRVRQAQRHKKLFERGQATRRSQSKASYVGNANRLHYPRRYRIRNGDKKFHDAIFSTRQT